MDMSFYDKENHCVYSTLSERSTPRYIIVTLENTKAKEKILKAFLENEHKLSGLKMALDFSTAALEAESKTLLLQKS